MKLLTIIIVLSILVAIEWYLREKTTPVDNEPVHKPPKSKQDIMAILQGKHPEPTATTVLLHDKYIPIMEESIRFPNQYCTRAEKQAYMKSPEWGVLKQQRLSLANHQCEHCGATSQLELHHQSYVNLLNEDIDDLRIVCGGPSGCHNKIHEAAGKLYFNKYGRENEYPLTLLSN